MNLPTNSHNSNPFILFDLPVLIASVILPCNSFDAIPPSANGLNLIFGAIGSRRACDAVKNDLYLHNDKDFLILSNYDNNVINSN